MLRSATLVLALTACDKGPIQEHRIRYEKGGLTSTGPVTYRIDVDLDKRTLVARTEKTTEHALSETEAKQLADVAGCARDEAPGPDPHVSDSYEHIVLDGDQRKEITQPGPMTAACAAKLEIRLETLAGWR
jgi:hypothetical protein